MSNKSEMASQLLSECLLKGMVMTASCCLECSCPLMRHRQNKELICPMCTSNAPDICSESEKHSQPLESEIESEKTFLADNSSLTSSNEISALLGRRMLEGWTLLETVCPGVSCFQVPLVRNKEKYSECVSCNTRYLLESDYDPSIHQVNLDANQKQVENALASPIKTSQASIVKNSAIHKEAFSVKPVHYKNIQENEQIESLVSCSSSIQDTISDSAKILQAKIALINNELKLSTHSQEIKKLASTLMECFEALNASIRLSKLLKE